MNIVCTRADNIRCSVKTKNINDRSSTGQGFAVYNNVSLIE